MLRHFPMLINGELVGAKDGGVFKSANPATGEPWATAPAATAADVDSAVRAADAAFRGGEWAGISPTERGRALRRAGDLLAEHAEELGRIETTDTGKLFKETKWQAKYVAEFFEFYAGCADKICGETLPIDKPDLLVFTEREPIGVVAAIVPWNSQLFLSAIKIAPALAAGNAIVLKASERAPAPMLEFARLLGESGIFPPGVVNIITGHGDPCGKALTSHPLVARVSFTGGAAAGRQVARNAAENFAQTSLELGGKSPIIVFNDADLEGAVNGVCGGIFGASGQSCVAGSRLYLQEDIADEFLRRLVARAAELRIGDPMDEKTDMGPLCAKAQLENVEREVAHALAEGGEALIGGARPPSFPSGLYYSPTIIACPRNDMRIVATELFGPVLCALRFQSEEEAIRLANESAYGLGAGVFSQNGARALRVAKKIQAGIVWVNTYRIISPIAEFGGVKGSGYGRESGMQALRDYTRPKTVWVNTSAAPLSGRMITR